MNARGKYIAASALSGLPNNGNQKDTHDFNYKMKTM